MSNMSDNSKSVLNIIEWFAHDDLAPSVFLKSDLVPDKMTQSQFAGELRTKKIRRTARHIYYRQKIWTLQYGIDLKPKPANVAVALCRNFGWNIAIPVSLARFWLGLETRPNDFKEFFYNEPIARTYEDAGLTLLPADNSRLFELSILGQMIRLGISADMPLQQLQELGRHAAHGYFDKERVREPLLKDLASGLLNEREFFVARAFLDAKDIGVRHEAPDNFDPTKHGDAPRLTDWTTFESGDELFLTASRIDGHPSFPDGERLRHSSPLIWIDKKRGWARTQSRFYRLLKKDEDDEVS